MPPGDKTGPLSVSSRAGRQRLPAVLRALRFAFATLGPVLPGLMGALAYRLWFRTHRHPAPRAEQLVAAAAERSILQVDNIPVAVYSWGQGSVVAFIHGWSGRGTQVAAFIQPLLKAGYRVISFDAPAHGETPGQQTNIMEIAAVLQALAEEFGPLSAAITHSFGGMVLAYAMTHGLGVDRVVCIGAPAQLEFLLESFARTLAIPAAVIEVLRSRLEQRFDADLGERVSTDANARRLTTPALIIHDADDRDVPWEQGEQIALAWPGARFMKTQGLGHRRILRDPATVNAVVDFIAPGSAG